MEVLIKGKNMDVADETQEYIHRKMNKLERRLPNIDEVTVELSQEMTKAVENRFVAQVTISSHGTLLRGEERAVTTNAAIDNVIDVLNRQIERFKGKLYRSQRRGESPRKSLAITQEETTPIAKIKRFPVRSMSAEEAIEQMELLSHNFFIFLNEENERSADIAQESNRSVLGLSGRFY